jgi:hypothetical protein
MDCIKHHQIVRRFIPPMGNQYRTDVAKTAEPFLVFNVDFDAAHGEEPNSPTDSSALIIYDIFIPLLGIFIIFFNLLVVISSGLILKKGKL